MHPNSNIFSYRTCVYGGVILIEATVCGGFLFQKAEHGSKELQLLGFMSSLTTLTISGALAIYQVYGYHPSLLSDMAIRPTGNISRRELIRAKRVFLDKRPGLLLRPPKRRKEGNLLSDRLIMVINVSKDYLSCHMNSTSINIPTISAGTFSLILRIVSLSNLLSCFCESVYCIWSLQKKMFLKSCPVSEINIDVMIM